MKKRLREGAKLIVIDPRRIDLVRTPHVEAAHHLPLQARHQCRGADGAGACHRHRRAWSTRRSSASAATSTNSSDWAEFVASPENSPEAARAVTGVPAADLRGGGAPLRHRRQRRDLLRPRRHRAQPGLDRGHGDRQPRHGDRQYRPPRRRRESAARPEQRAGRLRHGLLPARASRLPPHLRRRRPAPLFETLWGVAARRRARPAHPQHARRRRRWHLQGHLHPGRGHPAVRPQHQARRRRPRGDGMRRRARPLPRTRPPTTPTSSCRARPSSRRTAPSPTPSAASSWSAR